MRIARRSAIALLLSMGFGFGPSHAHAQESQIRWADIPCSEEKLRVPPGLRCRATAEYSGVADAISGATGQSIFRRWIALGTLNGEKLYYYAIEGVSAGGYISVVSSVESSIKGLSPDAKDAKSFSPMAQLGGGDYQTFVGSDGTNCVGIRKLGPSHKKGYQWTLHATKCAAKGKSLSPDEIGQFISSAGFSA